MKDLPSTQIHGDARMNVCVFCSASDIDERYQVDAIALAQGLAQAGHTFVWGGSNTGLMKICADAAQSSGGRIVGISVEHFRSVARPTADELIIASDMAERKALMLNRSDVVIALAGGLGTIDELLGTVKMKKIGAHDITVIVLNTSGFYDGLRHQLETMDRLGFLPVALNELVTFVSSADEALSVISAMQATRVDL